MKTQKTPIELCTDVSGLQIQLRQAQLGISMLEAEIVGDMRQSVLLETIQQQLENISAIAQPVEF